MRWCMVIVVRAGCWRSGCPKNLVMLPGNPIIGCPRRIHTAVGFLLGWVETVRTNEMVDATVRAWKGSLRVLTTSTSRSLTCPIRAARPWLTALIVPSLRLGLDHIVIWMNECKWRAIGKGKRKRCKQGRRVHWKSKHTSLYLARYIFSASA